MGYTIDEFLEYVEPRIFTRGEDYYENGMVKKVIKSDGHYTAKVSGSNTTPYTVKIFFDKDETIEDWSCSCPYDFSDVCKHIVALLLAIENGDYIEKKQLSLRARLGMNLWENCLPMLAKKNWRGWFWTIAREMTVFVWRRW